MAENVVKYGEVPKGWEVMGTCSSMQHLREAAGQTVCRPATSRAMRPSSILCRAVKERKIDGEQGAPWGDVVYVIQRS